MKRIIMIAAVSAVICSPAFAGGGKSALNIGAVVSTGKGGLVGTLLGAGSGHGTTGVATQVSVSTGKSGVLGLLLGSGKGSDSHGGGHGGW